MSEGRTQNRPACAVNPVTELFRRAADLPEEDRAGALTYFDAQHILRLTVKGFLIKRFPAGCIEVTVNRVALAP